MAQGRPAGGRIGSGCAHTIGSPNDCPIHMYNVGIQLANKQDRQGVVLEERAAAHTEPSRVNKDFFKWEQRGLTIQQNYRNSQLIPRRKEQ
jgi:hypothetical protein